MFFAAVLEKMRAAILLLVFVAAPVAAFAPVEAWDAPEDDVRQLTVNSYGSNSYGSNSYGSNSYSTATTPAPTPSGDSTDAPTAPVVLLQATMTFTGYTAATFDQDGPEGTAFKNAIAAELGDTVSPSDVEITSVADGSGRRRLADSVVITYQVKTTAANKAAVKAKVAEIVDDATAFTAAFTSGVTTTPADFSVTAAPAEEVAAATTTTADDGGVSPASKASASALVSAVAIAISFVMLS